MMFISSSRYQRSWFALLSPSLARHMTTYDAPYGELDYRSWPLAIHLFNFRNAAFVLRVGEVDLDDPCSAKYPTAITSLVLTARGISWLGSGELLETVALPPKRRVRLAVPV